MDTMRTSAVSLVFCLLALTQAPVSAMSLSGNTFASLGPEIDPQSNWPLAEQATALQNALDADKGALVRELSAYYALNNHNPVWVKNGRWTEKAEDLIARLSNAEYDGLDPQNYVKPVFSTLDPLTSDQKTQSLAELEMSKAVISFVRHLSSGQVNPAELNISSSTSVTPARKILDDMVAANDVSTVIAAYEPPHAGYHALRAALVTALDSEAMAAKKPPVIPSGPLLKEGMRDERVPVLRARFALNASTEEAIMDSALAEALRSFQKENGLKATGRLNRYTLAALNRQAALQPQQLRQDDLIVNMERWRWLPRDLGRLHVMVNIPEFLVRVTKDSKTTYEGRVVVGKTITPTPVFSDEIEYVVVNPSWNVPPSIVRKEMMPLLQRNPDEFFRRGYEVTQDRRGNLNFRQPPSERNALGRVKFVFPNDHSVYLHDTPAKGYFARNVRAFSHGCVRVAEPLNFADALLTQETSLNSRMIRRLYGRSERYLNLKNHVPVHLVYFTAFANEEGALEHRADLYGIDRKLKSLMGLNKRA